MSVLVYISSSDSKVSRVEKETIAFGQALARQTGLDCQLFHIGTTFPGEILDADVHQAILIDNRNHGFDSKRDAEIISKLAQESNASYLLLPHNSRGKALLGRLAIRLKAGAASDVTSFSNSEGGIHFYRNSYSGKARTSESFTTDRVVLAVSGDGMVYEGGKDQRSTSDLSIEAAAPNSRVLERVEQDSDISLADASLVVSAGRGMKSAENWELVEELARTIGAATACSRPVADSDWRPHHEHVGQTGLSIKPNLYVAIGISGAIQHLAGVNNSKTIVVINNDPEAPFFKAADYGICGDLFEVVPKLTQAIKETS